MGDNLHTAPVTGDRQVETRSSHVTGIVLLNRLLCTAQKRQFPSHHLITPPQFRITCHDPLATLFRMAPYRPTRPKIEVSHPLASDRPSHHVSLSRQGFALPFIHCAETAVASLKYRNGCREISPPPDEMRLCETVTVKGIAVPIPSVKFMFHRLDTYLRSRKHIQKTTQGITIPAHFFLLFTPSPLILLSLQFQHLHSITGLVRQTWKLLCCSRHGTVCTADTWTRVETTF